MGKKEGKEFDKSTKKLTPKQKLFCYFYVLNESTRSNGTLSYDSAYDIRLLEKDKTRLKDDSGREIKGTSEYEKAYDVCSVNASRLLRLAKIQEENMGLLESLFNDEKIDLRLADIIFNGKDSDSISAIKEYNSLKARIQKGLQNALNEGEISENILFYIPKNGREENN